MRACVIHLFTSAVIIVLCFASTSSAQPGAIDVPPMPGDLEVEEGNRVFFKGSAVGTQNYICAPDGANVKWTLFGPQATLFLTFKGEISQQVATHFLSPNPDEGGMPRASWQHSLDSSQVWARMIKSSTDGTYVEPGAIPWLLLKIMGKQLGPTGGSFFANTTFIQRLNTSGGVAPSIGCSSWSEVGRTVLVPYTTDYYFYKAE